MNRMTDIDKARHIMGDNIIGEEEIVSLDDRWAFSTGKSINEVPYSEEELYAHMEDYLLVLGKDKFKDGSDVTIRNMINRVGKNPDIYEPCFYNQDWYEKENFIDTRMDSGWFFIRKKVYEESRGVMPLELMKKHEFPLAVVCTYSFFMAWYSKGIKLWDQDFVWCKDTDHNGDRIYVGRYHDAEGVNKNGFNIHRHLSLRKCYACID